MERFIYDESNGLWYELQGDYYIPCVTAPENDQPIGIWGQRYLQYIREHRKAVYTSLLLAGKLNDHLAQVYSHAVKMFAYLVKQMAETEGITKHLKAKDQKAWVQRMNNFRYTAEEIVNAEAIHT